MRVTEIRSGRFESAGGDVVFENATARDVDFSNLVFEAFTAHSGFRLSAETAWLCRSGMTEVPPMRVACPHRCPHGAFTPLGPLGIVQKGRPRHGSTMLGP